MFEYFKSSPEDDIVKSLTKRLSGIKINRKFSSEIVERSVIKIWTYNFVIDDLDINLVAIFRVNLVNYKCNITYTLDIDGLRMRCRDKHMKRLASKLDDELTRVKDEDDDILRKDIRNILRSKK